VRGQALRAARISLAQLETRRCQRTWQLCPFEESSTGSDDDAKVATTDSLEGFYSLTGNLCVSFRLAEAFARRIEGYDLRLDERGEIGQPSLGAGYVVTDDNKEALAGVLSECRYDQGVARSMKATQSTASSRSGKLVSELPEFGERFDDGEQLWERHGAR